MYVGVPLEGDRHVTITFNGHGESKCDYLGTVAATALAARWWKENGNRRITGVFGSVEVFDNYCYHAKLQSGNLPRFRDRLIQELDSLGVYHAEDFDFTPHVTLSYGQEPEDNPFEGTTLVVDTLAIVSRNFKRTEIAV